MRKVIYLLSVLAITVALASCDKEDNEKFATPNLETRATALGFSDVDAYKAFVDEQCAEANHENCDVWDDGTHHTCAYSEHIGTNHDGTRHNGTAHGTHDTNGHSHNSHGNHNSENHGGNSHSNNSNGNHSGENHGGNHH